MSTQFVVVCAAVA